MSFLGARDAVVTELNSAFTEFTAVGVLNPNLDQEEAKELTVLVAPIQQILTRDTRKKTLATYTIQIAVIQKVVSTGVADETVLTTSTEIMEHFFNKNLPDGQNPPDFGSGAVSSIPFYDYDYLDEYNLVVSIIQVEYMEQI